jgi:nucleoside-diphosphate-sugar epimerase
MSRTILVIGARSALAKAAIDVLAKDSKIITAGRKDCDVYCDIAQGVTIPAGVDVVINFAAAFSGKTDEEIIAAEKTNVLGVLNVCTAAREAGVRQVVLISSIFALLGKSSPQFSIYALTKRHGDELAEWYCGLHGLPLTILRPSQIYGDSQVFAKHQPFFYGMMDTAERGEDIILWGGHDPRRNYIHAQDLAQIISRVIERQVTGIYQAVSPADVTYKQIAGAAQAAFAKGGAVRFDAGRPDIPDNITPIDTSLYDKINFRPAISIEEGIGRIAVYRKKGQA